ncbi:MAG: UvrD-helicase domain-containing protein, partial [Dehalococcoidia bacterium]
MTNTSRDRIVGTARGSLEETIYAEAGAGTGKTTALVERIVNLLLSDDVKPENIVAVTFTVAAASELRQRVRESLEEHALGSANTGANSNRLNEALESLDAAYIGTIHSFAQSLLAERPLEAGLPPVFEVNDPVVSDDLFDRAWRELLDTELGNVEFAQAVGDLQRL